MADIAFACPECGQGLEAPGEMAGESVACPACNAELAVPEPAPAQNPVDILAAEQEKATATELSADDDSDTQNSCPGCGATMEAGAVLCIECGFHQGLGKKISTDLS